MSVISRRTVLRAWLPIALAAVALGGAGYALAGPEDDATPVPTEVLDERPTDTMSISYGWSPYPSSPHLRDACATAALQIEELATKLDSGAFSADIRPALTDEVARSRDWIARGCPAGEGGDTMAAGTYAAQRAVNEAYAAWCASDSLDPPTSAPYTTTNGHGSAGVMIMLPQGATPAQTKAAICGDASGD
ncbi:MAG: hypothetical protein IT303_10110 [Dehalococcoidia bacterium]|nr:hypothetical protein [Dehalococcoidia bacterium]